MYALIDSVRFTTWTTCSYPSIIFAFNLQIPVAPEVEEETPAPSWVRTWLEPHPELQEYVDSFLENGLEEEVLLACSLLVAFPDDCSLLAGNS